jgi:methionyl-tRNA formyltransferase
MTKFIIYGNCAVSISYAKAIIDNKNCELVAIVTLEESLLPLNAIDISIFAKQNSIKCIKTIDLNSSRTISEIKILNPDIAVVAWPNIIKQDVLDIVNLYTIGTHPTNLPLNKGRHPLHWLICLDTFHTVLSFFKMGTGIDDGDIILKKKFKVKKKSNINDFNSEMCKVSYIGMSEICNKVSSHKIQFTKQDDKKSTSFRKRTFFDSLIDPRMSSASIINHINSFCEPYHCASLIIEKEIFKINKAIVIKSNNNLSEYGKVFFMCNDYIDMRVEDNTLRLYFKNKSKIIDDLRYVYTPTYYYNKYNNYFKEKLYE